jgi:hypothetical protein
VRKGLTVSTMLYVRRPRGDKIPSGKGMSLGGVSMDEEMLPKFDYYLDESDPEVVVLRRQDGTFVAAFSAQGVTREGILEAAREDYAALLRKNVGHLASESEK